MTWTSRCCIITEASLKWNKELPAVVWSESTCLKSQPVKKKIKKGFGFQYIGTFTETKIECTPAVFHPAEDGLTSGRLKPNTFKWWIRWVFNKRSNYYYWPKPVTRGSDVFMAVLLESRSWSNKLPVPVPQYLWWTGDQATRCVVTITLYTPGSHQAVDTSLTLPKRVGKWQSHFFFHSETNWKKNHLKFC